LEEPVEQPLAADELRLVWPILNSEERIEGFNLLSRGEAHDFFLDASPRSQGTIVGSCPANEQRLWLRLLAPDDAADLLQEFAPEERAKLVDLLDETTRREVLGLLAYAEDQAGGLMSPRFARARPEARVDEAIGYVRRQARDHLETIYYVYVLDAEQHLLGVVSFRELLTAPGEKLVREVMKTDVITVPEDMDQESVAKVIAGEDILAVPVVDAEGRMKGIVTVDDVVDVVQEEATEDIQKLGGMEALDIPYMQTRFRTMIKKRGVWLAVLFVGEMLTATAMAQYQDEIHQAIVLTLFMPLIISSGGNSGSQATTLVIRAMALGEVHLRDWWRIVRRELAIGFVLGLILATIGLLRITVFQGIFHTYGEYWARVGFTVAASLVGVVVCGTISGSMLPLLLRKLGLDPASASAPFVATLVDVAGLVIYFNVAAIVLRGSLL
jgi:magnesium transporter